MLPPKEKARGTPCAPTGVSRATGDRGQVCHLRVIEPELGPGWALPRLPCSVQPASACPALPSTPLTFPCLGPHNHQPPEGHEGSDARPGSCAVCVGDSGCTQAGAGAGRGSALLGALCLEQGCVCSRCYLHGARGPVCDFARAVTSGLRSCHHQDSGSSCLSLGISLCPPPPALSPIAESPAPAPLPCVIGTERTSIWENWAPASWKQLRAVLGGPGVHPVTWFSAGGSSWQMLLGVQFSAPLGLRPLCALCPGSVVSGTLASPWLTALS